MIIDGHVHIWPDKIAAKVVERLPGILGHDIHGNGTAAGLLEDMAAAGINRAVIVGVAEAPRLVTATNDWLMSVDDPRLIPFGTVHPDFEDYAGEVERLRRAGFKGIKMHPLFQGVRPDDERVMRICEAMGDDLIALFHVGAGSVAAAEQPEQILSTPERIARVIDAFPRLTVIAAHLGGHMMWDEAKRHLLGKNVYFDTAWPPSLDSLDPEATAAFIRKHGAEKVLFGTDYPFGHLPRERDAFLRLPLSSEEKDLVLGKNAARLLGLDY